MSSSCGCAYPRSSNESCEALQLRLHQLEAARGKEMHSHGELIGRLKREAESLRTHQSDMQVALAKLSTERVRIEAEHQTMRAKWLQEREQHGSAKAVAVGLRNEIQQRQEQTLQKLRDLNESIEKLQHQEREQLIHQGVLQAQLDALRTDHQLVVTARENALQALSSQTLENSRLSDALRTKQLEAEARAQRVQMLSDDLARYRDANAIAQDQIKALQRDLDRALQTHNRTLAWRKRETDTASARIFRQTLFLSWKSSALGKQRSSVRAFNTRLQAKSVTLDAMQAQLAVKLAEAKMYLSQIRKEVAEYPSQMALFRDDMCLAKLPQLLEQIQINREQCAMAIADTEAKQLAKLQAANLLFETRRTIFKQRQRATLALLHKAKWVELGHRAFYDWKDVYLRNIVAQTTHAAMLAQQQVQSLIVHSLQATTAQDSYSPEHNQRSRQQQETASQSQDSKQRFYFPSLTQQQQQRALLKKSKNGVRSAYCDDVGEFERDTRSEHQRSCDQSSNLTAATLAATDADWRRWRRVNPVALHKRKEEWSAVSSLPLSPTSRISSATMQRQRRKR